MRTDKYPLAFGLRASVPCARLTVRRRQVARYVGLLCCLAGVVLVSAVCFGVVWCLPFEIWLSYCAKTTGTFENHAVLQT